MFHLSLLERQDKIWTWHWVTAKMPIKSPLRIDIQSLHSFWQEVKAQAVGIWNGSVTWGDRGFKYPQLLDLPNRKFSAASGSSYFCLKPVVCIYQMLNKLYVKFWLNWIDVALVNDENVLEPFQILNIPNNDSSPMYETNFTKSFPSKYCGWRSGGNCVWPRAEILYPKLPSSIILHNLTTRFWLSTVSGGVVLNLNVLHCAGYRHQYAVEIRFLVAKHNYAGHLSNSSTSYAQGS